MIYLEVPMQWRNVVSLTGPSEVPLAKSVGAHAPEYLKCHILVYKIT